MSEGDNLERRLGTIERAIADGDEGLDGLGDAARLAGRVEDVEGSLADAEERIAELEAATQALRGYVGNVRSVNESVEQRADAALAAVDRLQDAERAENTQGRTRLERGEDRAASDASDAHGSRHGESLADASEGPRGATDGSDGRDHAKPDGSRSGLGRSPDRAAAATEANAPTATTAGAEPPSGTESPAAGDHCPHCAATLASDGGREGEPRTPTPEADDDGLLARLRDAL